MILLGQLVAASVLLLDDNAVKDRLHILAVLGKVFMAQLRLLRRFCLSEALRLLFPCQFVDPIDLGFVHQLSSFNTIFITLQPPGCRWPKES